MINKIKGLKVVGLKGFERTKKKAVQLQYILFSDKKTVIELEEQDPYTYHDSSHCARELTVRHDPKFWKMLMTDKKSFKNANYLNYDNWYKRKRENK